MRKTVALLISVFIGYGVFASGGDDHAFVHKGDKAFRKARLAEALSYYLQALSADPKDCYANFQAGAIYYLTDSARIKSLPYFENTLKYAKPQEDDTIVDAYYYLGNCYILKQDYPAAINAFQKYLAHLVDDNFDAEMMKEVRYNIELCKHAPELTQRSSDSASYAINGKLQPTYVKNLGSMVNTPYPEYAEVVADKDSTIIFTSRRPASQSGRVEYPTGSYYEDMFLAKKDAKGQWQPPTLFSTQLQIKPSRLNLASVCISADNKTLFIFHKGLIFESHKSSSGWSKPERVGEKIKSIKKFMPSVFLSFDGKQLFMVSDKKGGYGGKDIYSSTKDDKGIWSDPQNLGPDINSSFDEDAPFLMPDNKTLFFSSKGHNGLGGYDIFKSVYENGKWTKPINVGAPINSSADDVFFTYDTAAKKGYFSSSRINTGYGDIDLYSFSFTCDNIENTIVKGKLSDEDKIPSSFEITATDVKAQTTTMASTDVSAGQYSLQLKPDTKYSLSIKAASYLPVTIYLTTPHQCDAYNLYQLITLDRVRNFDSNKAYYTGQEIIMKNIFYTTSQQKLKKINGALIKAQFNSNDTLALWAKDTTFAMFYTQSQIDSLNPHAVKVVATTTQPTLKLPKGPVVQFELNKATVAKSYHSSLDSIAKAMHTNTKIKVQITGYADNTGKPEHNLKLSQQRAKAVAQYLINKGVRTSNIHSEGKGIDNPVAPNDGTHNYLNRRAELMIIQ